jgi:GntR family transcriptional regulator
VTVPRPPLHETLTGYFRSEIVAGRLMPGDQLPTGRQMAAQFDVSQTTVDKVIAALNAVGLVEIRPGKGVFVSARRTVSAAAPAAQLALRIAGRELDGDRAEIREARVVDAPLQVASGLDIEPGANVIQRHVAVLSRNQTVQLITSWFPSKLAKAVPQLLDRRPLPSIIDGLHPARGEDWITARMPGIEEQRQLAITRWHALVVIASRRFDSDGSIIEYTELVARPGTAVTYRYKFEHP